jgi:hypothetical protein
MWVSGKYGMALDFDGIDDYVEVPHTPGLNPTDAFTLEAWIYIQQYTYYPSVISKGNVGHQYDESYCMFISPSGQLGFLVNNDGTSSGRSIVIGSVIPLNTWTHVAATFDGTTIRSYINSALDMHTTHSGGIHITSNYPVLIGKSERQNDPQGLTSTFFDGIIDEARIWGRALTSCQLQLAMDAKLEILPDAGLVIYQSSYHDLSHGDTVPICIISDYEITSIALNPNRGATPKKTEGSITATVNPDGYSGSIVVSQDSSKPCKTLHVWVTLETGEHLGVNLHFQR